jgi:putative Mn2+ efflux pump MntP
MSLLDILLLSVALAMDCFTVSIVSGVIMRQRLWRMILQMSFFFGLFQAAMPFIGWICTKHFSKYIEAYDHWIAFGLLVIIGGNMIRESFLPAEEHHFNPAHLKTQLTLAFATSIDALAIGISFACTGYRTLASMTVPLICIGLTSLAFGIVGNLLGVRFGESISKRLCPELFGGIILILIGLKILASHLLGL